jgi:ATP/ADP translocase
VTRSLRLQLLLIMLSVLNWASSKIKNLECRLKNVIEPFQRRMIIEHVKKTRKRETSMFKQTNNILKSRFTWLIIGIILFFCLHVMFKFSSEISINRQRDHNNNTIIYHLSSVNNYSLLPCE